MGHHSLYSNQTANNSVAIGYYSLCSNTTGNSSTALGTATLQAHTTGTDNTAIGYHSLRCVTTGQLNSALGYASGRSITTGLGNLTLGRDAGRSDSPFEITTENNRIVLGNNNISNAYIKVALTVTSDLRDKTEIGDVPHGLDFVDKLKPVSFKFKKSREDDTPTGTKHYGFLAQDILELEGSDNVIIDDEQPDKLKYKGEHLVPVLVNAIKELKAEIDKLKNK